MVIIVAPEQAETVTTALTQSGETVVPIGAVEARAAEQDRVIIDGIENQWLR
jgi:phosphoribosylaminoimidazole (AIR) synthetase